MTELEVHGSLQDNVLKVPDRKVQGYSSKTYSLKRYLRAQDSEYYIVRVHSKERGHITSSHQEDGKNVAVPLQVNLYEVGDCFFLSRCLTPPHFICFSLKFSQAHHLRKTNFTPLLLESRIYFKNITLYQTSPSGLEA